MSALGVMVADPRPPELMVIELIMLPVHMLRSNQNLDRHYGINGDSGKKYNMRFLFSSSECRLHDLPRARRRRYLIAGDYAARPYEQCLISGREMFFIVVRGFPCLSDMSKMTGI